MADDAARRRALIDDRRQRVQDLRKMRESQWSASVQGSATAPPGATATRKTDKIIPTPSFGDPTAAPDADIDQLVTSLIGQVGGPAQPLGTAPLLPDPPSKQAAAAAVPEARPSSLAAPLAILDIPPALRESFSKEVQTSPWDPPARSENPVSVESDSPDKLEESERDDVLVNAEVKSPEALPVVLDTETRAAIERMPEYESFLGRASKIAQRLLDDRYSPLVDYAAATTALQTSGAEVLSLAHTFGVSGTGVVTAVDWHPTHPELFLVGQNTLSDNNDTTPGFVSIWSCRAPSTPEYELHAPSRVLAAQFFPQTPHLVAATTASGQLCIWDIRTNTRQPSQRTPLSVDGHTQPVFGLSVTGHAHQAHSITTVSTDGRLCVWTLDMLARPHETHELRARNRPLSCSALAPSPHDSRSLYIGCEDGSIHFVQRLGPKPSVDWSRPGHHTGPVTALSCHSPAALAVLRDADPSASHTSTAGLLLSSSFDWTASLWAAQRESPLASFTETASDYIHDIQWAPQNPGMFAWVDGAGGCALWDLGRSADTPLATLDHDVPLSKLRWSADGRTLALGGADGLVRLYTVNAETLAKANPAQAAAQFTHMASQSIAR